jgi:protein SCO1/2
MTSLPVQALNASATKARAYAFLFTLVLAAAAWPCSAQEIGAAQPPPALLQSVGITQRLNQQVPGDLTFRDETGKTVKLGDFFVTKPVVLSLVYFNCPFMCTEVLNGELRALQGISLNLGQDYEAVTVSFDPKDGQPQAAEKSSLYTALYARRAVPGKWHFLTGDQKSVQTLANAVGFGYSYDAPTGQFAHATSIMVLTPEGRVSRYFYGVQYPSRDVRLGLVEASEGRIGSPTDAALLYCFHYDPLTGKYGLIISNVIRIAGGTTLLVMGIVLFLLFRRENYGLASSPVPSRVRARGTTSGGKGIEA